MTAKRDKFKALLKEKGLKVTTQRVMVLEVLSQCPDRHLTAEEIYELVKADYPEIGLATVYRTIQLLLELNLVDRINLDDGYVRYEIGQADNSEVKHHHHHLICLECGKVSSFEDDLLDELEKKIIDTASFQVTDHEVKLYGYCKECLSKKG
ncbi:Fur family transcriptional regulator [Anaerobium acetethylicum]|uniref:Fur family transcriptional regulator, ferric uptake regulator n=1 Tax=Anaerobium acetethylicum TaxID=1619234 RepID=A0A1D3TQS7_9FIRM|nr:Fur family transcriptional regulator [Anaerobium acetethylicum]SCP95958.1 Fur family transcriptional regulator, ferric uptake regulator [Anaerobium acetethylicum]